MARGDRRKCKCCRESDPTRVTVITSATVRRPAAEQPAKPPAKRAGSTLRIKAVAQIAQRRPSW